MSVVEDIKARLGDRWWRLNHLYKIENEKGELVPFVLRPAQQRLLTQMWWLNLILKARQMGFSTVVTSFCWMRRCSTQTSNVGSSRKTKRRLGRSSAPKSRFPLIICLPGLNVDFVFCPDAVVLLGDTFCLGISRASKWGRRFALGPCSDFIFRSTVKSVQSTQKKLGKFAPEHSIPFTQIALLLLKVR